MSLTAISLLWNAADLVGKGQAGRAAPGSAADEHAQPTDQDASQSEALLRQLLSALQVWLSLARCMPCLSPSCIAMQLCNAAELDWCPPQAHSCVSVKILHVARFRDGVPEAYWSSSQFSDLVCWAAEPEHGHAARSAQHRRAHAVLGGHQPGQQAVPSCLGRGAVGDLVPAPAAGAPACCYLLPYRGATPNTIQLPCPLYIHGVQACQPGS